MSWSKDLDIGKKIERLVCSQINLKYPKAFVVEGYNKGYDIEIPEVNQTIEVKFDYMSQRTGNYMIETKYGGEDSGITTTTATWWLQVDMDGQTWIKPESLEYVLRDYKIIDMKGIGDSKGKSGYLLPISALIFSPYAKYVAHSDKVKGQILDIVK